MPASRFGRNFLFRSRTATDQKGYEVKHMFMPKGYYTSQGYTGFLPDGRRMRFPTMEEYVDFLEELQGDAA